jgi:hypothetical protein
MQANVAPVPLAVHLVDSVRAESISLACAEADNVVM